MTTTSTHADVRTAFETDGFVVVRAFFVADVLRSVIANVDRFIRDIVPRLPSQHVFYENKRDRATLKQIQHMDEHDPWFGELIDKGRLRRLAEQLLGGPVIPKNLQYFNKPPRAGLPTPPHQDGYYFMLEPCEAVTMWLALDGVDEENGCVRYVRGSHRRGMRPHGRTKTLGFSQGVIDYGSEVDLASETALPASPGDLLVHHAMTIHRADGNRSASRARRALGFIYYDKRAREDANAHAAYQQKLAQEMKAAGRI